MKVAIQTRMYCQPTSIIELPIKSWDEIKEWYVKWDVLYYSLDGNIFHEIDLNNSPEESTEWKHPVSVKVFDPDTSKIISETDKEID